MADEAVQRRVKIASDFVLKSHPGGLEKTLQDVRVLVKDDSSSADQEVTNAFEKSLPLTLRQYHAEQLATVILPDQNHQVFVSNFNQLEGEECVYVDPRSKKSFRFDHLTKQPSDIVEWIPSESTETFRADLDKKLQHFVEDHYPESQCAVFFHNNAYVMVIGASRFNAGNFWNAQWKSVWKLEKEENRLVGTLEVTVHYFEEGNVMLQSKKYEEVTLEEGEKDDADKVMKRVKAAENAYHAALNENSRELTENVYRVLRRSLPITRNKVDWDKVANYKIGSELSQRNE